jgi:hypothetical protein
MDESLPFMDRVLLYLDGVEENGGAAAPEDYDNEDDDGGEGVPAPEVSQADIALLAAHKDMAALEAIYLPASEDAWVEDGHAARLAAYRAEAEICAQDRVTPVTLPDAAGAAEGDHAPDPGSSPVGAEPDDVNSGPDKRWGGGVTSPDAPELDVRWRAYDPGVPRVTSMG